MSAATIATALGGHQSRGGWWSCRCPVCQGENKLGFRDSGEGLVVHCFKGCSKAEILAGLGRLGLYDQANPGRAHELNPEELRQRQEAEEIGRAQRIANARDIWEQTGEAVDTIVAAYLGGRRLLGDIPYVVRIHRSLWHSESRERRPAMVARVDHVEHGSVAVHATYLAMDGSAKASVDPARKSFGPVGGAAVQLADPRPGEWLVVGEGIETVWSVTQSTGYPGWAALSAPGIEHLVLPPMVRKIIMAGDNDRSGRGQQAAQKAARRWILEGRTVKIAIPPVPDSDWNDCLMGRCPARIEEACHA